MKTFLLPQLASSGRMYNYVDCLVDGSPAVARMCIGVKQMDWLLSQCLCVCHARTGNSSLTIPQTLASLS